MKFRYQIVTMKENSTRTDKQQCHQLPHALRILRAYGMQVLHAVIQMTLNFTDSKTMDRVVVFSKKRRHISPLVFAEELNAHGERVSYLHVVEAKGDAFPIRQSECSVKVAKGCFNVCRLSSHMYILHRG